MKSRKKKIFKIVRDREQKLPKCYYPMVKVGWWIFSKWMRIGQHMDGSFGLYDTLSHPKDYQECIDLINRYFPKVEPPKPVTVQYITLYQEK